MATKIIKAWVDGSVQDVEVGYMTSPEQMLSPEERLDSLEDKHEVVFTDGNLLVGNGTTELEEMTPEEVLEHINASNFLPLTTAEYEAMEESNANTLYMLTDDEEPEYALQSDLTSHLNDTSNPHGVTAEQTGALPLSGGTMTGVLTTNTSNSVWGTDGGIKLGNNAYLVGNTYGEIGLRTSSCIYFRIGDTNKLRIKSTSVDPATTNALDLGTSDVQWKGIYGVNIYQGGKQVANKEDIPSTTEEWTFTLEDGSTVTKAVYVG